MVDRDHVLVLACLILGVFAGVGAGTVAGFLMRQVFVCGGLC